MALEKLPIAVVGMACRFPGGIESPEKYWEFLCRGGEAIGEIGPDRWATDYYFHPDPKTPGKSYTWAAGVLSDIEGFDAQFFGISPREAVQVDPQQRILLELAWEALEDAGCLPQSLAGSNCGVYVGVSNMDYANSRYEDPSSGDAYFMTGGVLSIAANRISYFLDLHGPSMSIDTACSSSLVAVHQACESISAGDCDAALVGGVNVLLTPYPFIGFSRASMLSPTGRCHAFDAAADGYVRAEGGAMLVLKPLEKARADGDPIRAVIVASGVNSDGRTSGLSLPSESAQRKLLKSVYARAGLKSGELRYIEAHGTGTAVGDPIEATAIGRGVAMERDHEDPLLIGSVKTNIGHLEPAAGVAGLLKVILSLEHDLIPPSRNFNTPNPNIRFDDLNLCVVTRRTPLKGNGFPVAMGVNSFGFGGTNAHVVVRKHERPLSRPMRNDSIDYHSVGKPASGPAKASWKNSRRDRSENVFADIHSEGRRASRKIEVAPRSKDFPDLIPLILSAQSHNGLVDAARALKETIERNRHSFYDICDTAGKRRQRFAHRLAVFAGNAGEMSARLEEFVAGRAAPAVVSGQAIGRPAKLALLFSGNGAQWQGMGCRLLRQDPVFADWLKRVDGLFRSMSGVSILKELDRPPEESSLHLTEIAQPALFAVQVGMFESLIARGLEPGAVVGHSVGEVAAAYAAGAYTLEQATRIIHERSRVQGRSRGQGKVAAIGLSADAVRKLIARLSIDVEIGAYNSPSSVTVAGPGAQLEMLGEIVKQQGALFRTLGLDYPFHTRAMDMLQKDLIDALRGLSAFKTRLPFVSTVTGAVLDSEYLDAEYWWHNVRKPVRMDKAMETLIESGFQVFMEISPHCILQGYALENLNAAGHGGRVVPTCRRDRDDDLELIEALCTAHVLGCELDLGKLFPVHGEFARLPHYPWQREKIWFERTTETFGLLNRTLEHPLLGYRLPQLADVWEQEIDLERIPWLGDHVVGGTVVFPAAGFIEMALAVSAMASPNASPAIEYLNISSPLVVNSGGTRRLRFVLTSDDGRFSIQSRPRLSTEGWTIHVTGRITRGARPYIRGQAQSASAKTAATRIDAGTVYSEAEKLGLRYGEVFRNLTVVDLGPDFALARIKSNVELLGSNDGYHLHPARLDACFHGLIGVARAQLEDASNAAFIPVHTGHVAYAGDCDDFTSVRIHLTLARPRSICARFELLDDSMRVVAVLQDVRFRRLQLNQDSRQTLPVYENVALRHFPKRLDRAGSMPSLESVASVAEASLGRITSSRRHATYSEKILTAGERLAAGFSAAVVGKAAEAGNWMTRHQLASSLEVNDAQMPWFNQLLMFLEQADVVERDNGRIRFASVPAFEDVQNQWKDTLAEFPAHQAELILAGFCGVHLGDLLSGTIQYDALIDDAALARLRAASPGFRFRDGVLCELLEYLATTWSNPRPLRVLELGLEGDPPDVRLCARLDEERVAHVYAVFRKNFCKDDGERSESPEDAGNALDLIPGNSAEPLVPNGFDVVVVSHLLHELADPSLALGRMRSLLAPGGLLMIAEPPQNFLIDFIRGGSPRWWRASKENLGNQSSLRGPQEWRQKLLESGLEAVSAVEEPNVDTRNAGFILIGRNDSAPAETNSPERETARSFLLLRERSGESRRIAVALEKTLTSGGHSVIHVEDGPRFKRIGAERFAVNCGEVDDFLRLFNILNGENKSCTDIVHLMGLSFEPDNMTTSLLEVQGRRCVSTVRLVQACLGSEHTSSIKAWLITARAGVLDLSDDLAGRFAPIPSQAPLWGLGRVIANEHSSMECHLIDLWVDKDAEKIAALLSSELARDDGETEVVLTAQDRYVSRMRQATLPITPEAAPNTLPSETVDGSDDGDKVALQLQIDRPGSISRLQWRTVARKSLGPGEVEVIPRATGLNFRDLMFASGLLPEEAIENGYAGATLGMECAGIVASVGAGIDELKIGDEVMGFAPACFSSRVVTGAHTLVKKPEGLSFEQAATIPVAYFTVVYGLKNLAGLGCGERVLIHGAAGGVGIAAIRYAQYRGAEIFATAGSEEKRDFLRLLGVPHVFDSRTLDFADEILARTEDKGVDVVLNSLSGEALARTLSILRPFGRFLELGKRDFFENTRIGLRPFRENLSYFSIDADQLLVERPDVAQRVFMEVMALFKQGVFAPLPYRVFPAASASEAFRYMQRSDHIGKIVVTHDKLPRPGKPPAPVEGEYRLSPDATYLVTGGLSGFGLATARWMVERGARSMVLLGRSGAQTDEARDKVRELEALGSSVHVLKADVADYQSLIDVFDHIDKKLPPLRGLVHSAMVVDDKLVRDLDEKRMRRVLSPKLLGAWNLHELTRKRVLDFFVLYSSATTSFGNPGLGNYVAANIYLESLTRLRRSKGLPATAVAWGPISDSGYLARNEAALHALTTFMGSSGLTSRKGFEALEHLLRDGTVCGAVLEFDWSAIRRALPTANLNRYELFNKEPDSGETGEQPEQSAKHILTQLPLDEAREAIIQLIIKIVAGIMRLSLDQVDPHASIVELGMDSLMAIEMHMSVNNRLGVNLPIMGLADIPTIAQLAEKIIAHERPDVVEVKADSDNSPEKSSALHTGTDN